MTELYIGLQSRPAETVFDLLGHREDDLTRSFAWAMSQSPRLIAAVLADLDLPFDPGSPWRLRVQHSKHTRGRTDIELETDHALLIFEAKVGWNLPTLRQLDLYEQRLHEKLERSAT